MTLNDIKILPVFMKEMNVIAVIVSYVFINVLRAPV